MICSTDSIFGRCSVSTSNRSWVRCILILLPSLFIFLPFPVVPPPFKERHNNCSNILPNLRTLFCVFYIKHSLHIHAFIKPLAMNQIYIKLLTNSQSWKFLTRTWFDIYSRGDNSIIFCISILFLLYFCDKIIKKKIFDVKVILQKDYIS